MAWLLRHERLEDERWWAVRFGLVAIVAMVLVSVYDIDSESMALLVVVSAPAVVGYWLRAWGLPVPAWTIPLAAVVTQVSAVLVDREAEGHAIASVLALFYAFFREPNQRLALLAAGITVPVPLVLYAYDLSDSEGWLYWTMGLVICAWFGSVANHLRGLVLELERRRHETTARAVSEERRRIAGDVHDLVGHSLSVMMLHLTAARRAVEGDPPQAGSSLAQAEDVGREAMTEIRRTIGLLRENEGDTQPVPTLGDLASLVGRYREAGMDVGLHLAPGAGSVDAARGLAAYRIVQEALVNVTKHATAAPVEVEVMLDDGDLRITVANRSGGGRVRPGRNGDGLGMVSMAERARSVGGTFTAGPSGEGWRVEAILPR